MNIITIDGESQFDKLPDFKVMTGNFPKNIRTSNDGVLPFIATGNPTITGNLMVCAFSDQGASAFIDISRPMEELEAIGKNSLTLPTISIMDISAVDVLHKANALTALGFNRFAIYTDNPTSDEAINFFQRVEALGVKIYIAIYDLHQQIFIRRKTSISVSGFIIKTPDRFKNIIFPNLLKIIPMLVSDHETVIVEEEIFKPMDAVKAIGMGAHSVILTHILASTHEAVGKVFEFQGSYYKEYSTSIRRDSQNSQLITGPVINVLVEFETTLRDVMLVTGMENLAELRNFYRYFDVDKMEFV